MFVRTAGDPRLVAEPLRRELQRLMPGNAASSTSAGSDTTLDYVLRPWRLGATMFTLFGALALVVAAVGLYGVIAYSVAQRTHEMGVRAALGASRGGLMRLVVGEGIRVTVMGIVLGGIAALAGGKFLAAMLFGVSASDPGVFLVVAVVLLSVAALASLIPAWRAGARRPHRRAARRLSGRVHEGHSRASAGSSGWSGGMRRSSRRSTPSWNSISTPSGNG